MDHKEGWALKNWWFWTLVSEKTWVPWTARRSSQSIIEGISTEYSLEGLILKLKFQDFGHLMWRTDLEILKSRSERDDTGWDGWMSSPTGCTWVWESSGSWWWIGKFGMLQFMRSQRAEYNLVTDWQDVTANQVRAECISGVKEN